ncbi:MAG: MarR family transcriptional regulator [Saprospiraceae bacterium]|nr:MarR family transcriptional regulator [Lewinella sp.]
MQQDIIQRLGYIALPSRLKRISDKLAHSARQMYRQLGMDIEPNWYPVLLLVQDQPGISVTELAAQLKFTHQSVMALTRKMINTGYLKAGKDSSDGRKLVFQLSRKGREILPKVAAVWDAGRRALEDMLHGDTGIMTYLDRLEAEMEEEGFGERIIGHMKES